MSSTPSPKDWLIVQCQACASPMKVRAEDAARARVSCPVCRTPVAMQAPRNAESPEFRAAMPRDSDRLIPDAMRRRPPDQVDREFMPTMGGTATAPPVVAPGFDDAFLGKLKTTEELHSGSHVKVKKRRKKGAKGTRDVLTDWDTSLETLPMAELDSDPWTNSVPIPEEVIKEKTRDFVVSEEREDGNIVRRVKRVRKRRLFTLAQLFFRRLSLGMRILTVTLVAGIGLGGLALAVGVFADKFKPTTYDDVVAESRPGQIFLTSADESSAVDAVKAFLAAVGTEGKLPLVRVPNRVKPMMEEWYGRYADKALEAGEVRTRSKLTAGGAYFVIVELDVIERLPGKNGARSTVTRSFAVEEKENADLSRTYKVDWETAVQWRPMSWEEFKQKRPTYNVPFRIKIKGNHYYNHYFTDEEKWLAAELYYPWPEGRNEFLFHGYILRDSKLFENLAIVTVAGNSASLILNLRYPEAPGSAEQVIIDSVEHDSWFYTTDTPPAGKK